MEILRWEGARVGVIRRLEGWVLVAYARKVAGGGGGVCGLWG